MNSKYTAEVFSAKLMGIWYMRIHTSDPFHQCQYFWTVWVERTIPEGEIPSPCILALGLACVCVNNFSLAVAIIAKIL